jgi:hypothetical protein
VIDKLPNLTQLVPRSITGGKTLQGGVTNRQINLLLDGRKVKTLPEGLYTFVVADHSSTQSFTLRGPGVNKRTTVKGKRRYTWTLSLAPGRYTYSSAGRRPRLRGSFRVT